MNSPSTERSHIESKIDQCMSRDQFPFRRKLRKAKTDEQVQSIAGDIESSSQLRERRLQQCPEVSYPAELPITERRSEICEAIRSHQVVVVAGETGSGKSTQLPKLCLEAGFGIGGLVGHTQPRRLAARSVASRIADELRVPLGKEVGYKIRFQDKTDFDSTYIKLMTDGILLAETQSDRFLNDYEAIILDEAHERSLNVDFLIGILHRLLEKRKDLRLIITSATIDAEKFADHFQTETREVPVIKVAGRTFPVELRYRPLVTGEGEEIDVFTGINDAVEELSREGSGDTLVFLPTERDIREAAKRLRGATLGNKKTEILPLYARLSNEEQNKIFNPGKNRRIVLATNVAESSLTVPRIHYVIDSGTARISKYSSRLKVQRLPIESVSRASADQRKGRCGRIAPGICIRLYDEEDFLSRDEFTTPEIRRTNLASVILQAKTLKLGELESIPFLDPPRADTIRDGYKTLFELGAVDDRRNLTPLGKKIARLPVDPRIARIILAGEDENCLQEILIIAAALEAQDPRLRPVDRQEAADNQHEKFLDEQSDFLSYLKLWDFVHQQRDKLSRSKFTKSLGQNFLSPARVREWGEVYRQLRDLVREHGMKSNHRRDDSASIHRALLTGFLFSVAYLGDEQEYNGAGGNKFRLWPGSGLFGSKPQWIVVAEVVETTRRYGRTAAKINPNWIEPLAKHLLKRSYSDPHWYPKSASVMAFEKVTLFGMPIVARRRTPYGKIDPKVSRQLFIQDGLVEEQLESGDPFFEHNRSIREELAEMAAKTRSRDFLVDEYAIYSYYNQRLPDNVVDLAGLRAWLKKDPTAVHMRIEDFIEQEDDEQTNDQFPAQWSNDSMTLPVTYNFQPGDDDDGVTITVPAEGLAQLNSEQLDWLVPGLLEEKLVALIRSLPKSIRRGLVPAPDTAKKVASELNFGEGPFLKTVAAKFSEVAAERIQPAEFRLEKLPPHLQMNVRVVDADGKEQVTGRDLDALRRDPSNRSKENTAPIDDGKWNRDELTKWSFGELPREIRVNRSGIELAAFPTLIDNQQDVQMRLRDSQSLSNFETRAAVRRLYAIAKRRDIRSQVKWLPNWEQTCLFASSLFSKANLEQEVIDLIADRAFLANEELPRDEREFNRRLLEAGSRIAGATQDAAKVVATTFESLHQCHFAIDELKTSRFQDARTDIQHQIQLLTKNGFLANTPWPWLQCYPRYLKAILQRIDKLKSGGLAKDSDHLRAILPFLEQLQARVESQPQSAYEPELIEYRWMLEEFRVSLFAQGLGTRVKVSPQRLEKQWQKSVE